MKVCLILSLSLLSRFCATSTGLLHYKEFWIKYCRFFLFNDFSVSSFFMSLHPYLILSVDVGQYSFIQFILPPSYAHTYPYTHTCTVDLPELSGCLEMHRGRHEPKERPLGHANANMFPHWRPMSALITSSSRPPGPIMAQGCLLKAM